MIHIFTLNVWMLLLSLLFTGAISRVDPLLSCSAEGMI